MSTASYETVETANWVPIGRRQRRATCLTLFSGRPHEEPGVRESVSRYPTGPLETPAKLPFLESGQPSLVTGFSNK
jgi:hypothetical protein